jgi:hypothetical protein
VLLAAAVLGSCRSLTRRSRFKLSALVLLGNALAVAPWQFLIFTRSAQPALLSTGAVPGIRDGLTFSVSSDEAFRKPAAVSPDVAALERRILARGEGLDSVPKIAAAMGEELHRNPVALIKLFGLKSLRAWYATDSGRHEAAIASVQAVYLCVSLTALFLSLWRPRGDSHLLALGVAIVTAYFWAATVASLSIVRYMIPAMGFLALLAARLFSARPAHESQGSRPLVI